MKRELINRLGTCLLAILAILLVDWAVNYTNFLYWNSPIRKMVLFLIYTPLVLIFLSNLTYKILFDFKSSNSAIALFVSISMIFSMFVADRLIGITLLWNRVTKVKRKIDPDLMKDDPLLGYRGAPYATGYYEAYIGDSIRIKSLVKMDSLGFRTTSSVKKTRIDDTLDLFLGCSITFGDLILAEDGFPSKTAEKLGHRFLNAGLSGYGLSQMVILADSLLPAMRFKYVFIQLSPHLVERSMGYSRTWLAGYKPAPYFYKDGAGYGLQYPHYRTSFKKKSRDWNLLPKTYIHKFLFTVTDGFKIEVLDFLKYKFVIGGQISGVLKKPTTDTVGLNIWCYRHIIDMARSHGVTPIFLKFYYPEDKYEEFMKDLDRQIVVADVDGPAKDSCAKYGTTYKQRYELHHPHPSGPIHYDTHPNPLMNTLISDAIFRTIQSNGIR